MKTLTVGQLIALLSKFDNDAEVVVWVATQDTTMTLGITQNTMAGDGCVHMAVSPRLVVVDGLIVRDEPLKSTVERSLSDQLQPNILE